MTNGGGQSEEDRCRKLTEKLGYEVCLSLVSSSLTCSVHPRQIPPTQFIQAHTVLKSLGKDYLDEPVMVLGGKRDVVRKVAQKRVYFVCVVVNNVLRVLSHNSYGFKKVYTPLDVKAWKPR